MSAVFISDVHLIDADSVKTRLVIRFLQEIASQFQNIYILGDFFDVWPGTTNYLIRRFEPVLSVLGGLVKAGHTVKYVEGNHDFRLGNYFSEQLGVKTYTESLVEEMGGKKVYMCHGDLGNPKEFGYRILRNLLRQNFVHTVARIVPEEFIFKLGSRSSVLSRNYTRHSETKDAQTRQIYRRAAEEIFAQGYDVVIMGHTHLPDDVTTRIGSRTCRYFNTGDWVKNFTFLEFDGSQFYTRTHPVKTL